MLYQKLLIRQPQAQCLARVLLLLPCHVPLGRRSLVTVTSSCWMRTRRQMEAPRDVPIDRNLLDGHRIYQGQDRENGEGHEGHADDDDDDDDDSVEDGEPYQGNSEIPKGMQSGDELDVRVVKITESYALCRPLDYPNIKGKISVQEMDEYDTAFDARMWVKENLIYRASVLKMLPPDKILFSLKRVRRVLKDDFQPYTICLFNVPYDLDDDDIIALMDGTVLDVAMSTHCPVDRDHLRSFVFVTFLHEADAMAAVRKWNVTKMPCKIGDETYHYRVRAKKSHRQDYRQRLQERLDEKMYQKLDRWNETPSERRARQMADRDLRSIIPWYCADRDHNEFFDQMGFSEAMEYSIKNNPRTQR